MCDTVPKETTAPDLAAQRARLREVMGWCPSCLPEKADAVKDEDLPWWLKLHDVDPVTLEEME